MEFNIGMIMPSTGPSSNVAQGIESSFKFELSKFDVRLSRIGVVINLIIFDDQNNPLLSEKSVIRAIEQGCILIIGPSDSACAAHVISNEQFKDIPFLLSFATDTNSEFKSASNAFRLTTPGWRRAEVLLERVILENESSNIQIASLRGIPTSFAQSAKSSIKELCSSHDVYINEFDFHLGPDGIDEGIPEIEDYKAPIILCAPSFEAKMFLKKAREIGFKGKFYGFGANSNWLDKDCVDTTLICDLNRADCHPAVATILRNFEITHPEVKNPSIASMLAAKIVVQLLEKIFEDKELNNIEYTRQKTVKVIKKSTFDGVFGSISFDQDGEMIGYESISMLTVTKSKRGIEFKGAADFQPTNTVVIAISKFNRENLNLVATWASIISLVITIVVIVI